MSKLYGPDEGYQTVGKRGRVNKPEKSPKKKHTAAYLSIRRVMSDLISDQEPVLSPPFNEVIDLDSLDEEEFVAHASKVMTEENPEGHPPPGAYAPTMKSLIERLDQASNKERTSYASVVQKIGKEQKVTKSVNFAPLEMQQKVRQGSQYAVATVQSTPTVRPEGMRQCTATERLGCFNSGKKVIATSTESVIVDDDEEIDFDIPELSKDDEEDDDYDVDREIKLRKEQVLSMRSSLVRGKRSMLQPGEEEEELPESPLQNTTSSLGSGASDASVETHSNSRKRKFSASSVPKSSHRLAKEYFREGKGNATRLISSQDSTQELNGDCPSPTIAPRAKAKRAALRLAAALPRRSTTSHPPTPVIEQGVYEKNSHLFYSLVERHATDSVTHINYREPEDVFTSALWVEDLTEEEYVLPAKDWDDHVMSDFEVAICENAQSRFEYLHERRDSFHNIHSVDDLRPLVEEFPPDMHMYLVLTGGALTNSVWATNSTFQRDKEKYLAAASKCTRQFGTFTVDFSDVPLSHIRVDHLLLLPISTIMEYLMHHGVSYRSIPWSYVDKQYSRSRHLSQREQVDATLEGLLDLPSDTTLPLKEWVKYLVDLAMYLNEVMTLKQDSYEVVHEQFSIRDESTMSKRDAAVFLEYNFPLENERLQDDASKHQLLQRATEFAFQENYIGDIREQCTIEWLVFIYFILWGQFPSTQNDQYNVPEIIKRVLTLNLDLELQHPPDLRHLLAGPNHLMWSFLKEDTRAQKLYGPSVDKATIGVHRLMVAGVYVFWCMEYTGSRNVDGDLSTGMLCLILWAKGILEPTQEYQPHFSSKIIPVHTMSTVLQGVKAIIQAGVPVAIIPPKRIIHDGMTDDDYRQYYNSKIQYVKQGTKESEEILFHRTSTWNKELHTGPSFFPKANGYVGDRSSVDGKGYLCKEGQRMISIVQRAITQATGSAHSIHQHTVVIPRNTQPGNSLSEGAGVRRSNHQPTIISLAQLQANRIAQANPFSTYVTSERLMAEWSTYTTTAEGYWETMAFHEVPKRGLRINDGLILISSDSSSHHQPNADIMQFTHVEYTVVHIDDAIVRLNYAGVLHNAPTTSNLTQHPLPAQLTMHIDNEYILFKDQLQPAPFAEPSGQRCDISRHGLSTSRATTTKVQPRPEEWLSLQQPRHTRERDNDTRSEDSDARKHTKSSYLQVGHSKVEVLGKNLVHDDILQTTAVRSLMEKGRLQLFLSAGGHGYFGNNFTAKNIIQGLLKYDSSSNEPTTLSARLQSSLNHAKTLVTQQAWYMHEELHKKIALCEYEQGFNSSVHSIHCAHFLPAKIAAETNYEIDSWSRWLASLEGMKLLFQELLGPQYGVTIQAMITEARDSRIGEMSNVIYLVQLTHLWRQELYRCARSVTPFQLPRHGAVFQPTQMDASAWQEVMKLQWSNLKTDLNVMDEFVYIQGLAARKMDLPHAFGHKPKQKGEVRGPPAPLPKVIAAPAKLKAKQEKKPSPAKKDQRDSMCIADLLNQYGAEQQIACDVPCRYPHYTAIAKGVTKAAAIGRVQLLGPKLHLTEATITFLKKKIEGDIKFK